MKKNVDLHSFHCYQLNLKKALNYVAVRILLAACLIVPLFSVAQVSPPVPKKRTDHNKQIIGYITQWGPWKDIAGLIPKGSFNQLNVDYSQYTILNFAFFGVAVDGSIHSGDYRNPNINQPGVDQQPAPLVNTDIYSSWDLYLLQGELDVLYNISDGSYAYSLGYRNSGGGWTNINTGESGAFPLSIHKQGGRLGIIDLAHQQGIKVMASIGGWSMSKHFGDMAADATKRARFVNDCKRLIAMGFDGIDIDWEYPGQAGMNFTGQARDYGNFAVLVEDIRAAIGAGKLITAAFTAVPSKFTQFDWARLSQSMDYFNFMTYDYNGGWSNKAGHNSPLYDYPGAEYSGFSLDATTQGIKAAGIPLSKVNLGVAFYGRGVITNGPAALNAATVKRQDTVSPDGTVMTCADFTNWPKDVWDGTPNYQAIVANTSGWTDHWDDNAKVPYKTNGTYFLSYDNERSVGLKAQYVKDQQLAGVIVWTATGDWMNLTSNTTQYGGKLVYSPNTTAPLVNKLNEVFGSGTTSNPPPSVSITAPANNATFASGSSVNITANATDAAPGTVSKVEFFQGTTKLGEDLSSPYSYTWSSPANGSYTITVKATDNEGAVTTSSAVTIKVGNTTGNPPSASITSPTNGASFTAPASITINANASDTDGSIAKVEFFNGSTKLGEDLSAPYSFSWTNVAAGSYNLTAKATDNSGLTGTSSVISVTVTSGNTCTTPAWLASNVYNNSDEVSKDGNKYIAKWWTQGEDPVTHSCSDCVWKLNGPCGGTTNSNPTSSISSPSNNASFTAPASITISANASDADGTISKVEFFNGSTKLGEDLTSPYAFSWTNVAAGNYSLSVKATDNSGGTGTSSTINISVKSTTNSNPTVGITSPVNNSSFTAPASITLSANASDVDGTIAKVEFFNGSSKLGEDSSSPYTFSWSNVASGTYSLTAKATDNAGGTATSGIVSITVNGSTGGACDGKPQYVENGGYVDGSQVVNVGNLYQCKPYPYSGWCNGAAWAYGPGTGTYWTDAWTLVGSCSSGARVDVEDEASVNLKVYPNPNTAGNALHIDLNDLYKEVKVTVQSLTGGKEYTYIFKNIKHVEVTLPEISSGMSLVKIQADNQSWTRKVILK